MADFQTLNLAQIYGAADQANAQNQENQIRQYQIKKLQDADTEDAAVKSAFNGAIGQDGTLDRKALLSNLYRVNPQKAMEAQQTFNTQDIAAAKSKREDAAANLTNKTATIKYLRDVLAGVHDQPSYENALGEAKSLGANVLTDGAPSQYDPEWVRGHVMDADTHIKQSTPNFEKVDLGGKVQIVDTNPYTNPSIKGTQFDKTMTPGEVASNDIAKDNLRVSQGRLTEEKRHNKVSEQNAVVDPAAIESTAQAIANGQLAPLSGFALKSPGAQRIMSRALEINPQLSAIDYAAGLKGAKDFGSGKLGSNVRSINVTMGHLDTLGDLVDALGNGNVQLLNKLGNTYASQTGQTAPTNFAAAKQIIGDEIVKSIVGTGGGVHDREIAQQALDAANSPQQLAGVAKTYKALLSDQLKGFEGQYKASTGRNDFQTKYLNDASRNLENNNPEQAKPPAAKSTAAIPIKSDADYNKLPKGTRFQAPDGTIRIKQ